jgi:orotate phosphoribosyltransferase
MPSVSELEKLLREHGAVREGHFVLASGNHSEHYVQTAQLMQEPKLVDEVLDDVSRKLEQTFGDVDKLLTAATGGITFAQQVGLKLNKTTIFAERDETNTLELNRGFEIFEGDSVLLVEDVVTTGGTLEELEDLVEEYGATVAGVFSMINRSGMDDWNDRPFLSLLTVDYPVYSPKDCPGCTEGDEAVRPGTKSVDGESD